MPRRKLFRTADAPYHVTVRANNRENFPVLPSVAWRYVRRSLAEAAERYSALVHSLVQMSNHLHLILTTPASNLDDVMRYTLSQTARRMNAASGRSNHIFGERYHWSLLDTAAGVAFATKYLLRNPVRAGIVASVFDYPYSTENDLRSDLPIVDGIGPLWRLVHRDAPNRRPWLDCPTPKEMEEIVGRALRRKQFRLPQRNGTKRLIHQLHASYGVPMLEELRMEEER